MQHEVVYTMSSPSPPRDTSNGHRLRLLAMAKGSGKNMLPIVATRPKEKELDDVDFDGSTSSDGDVSKYYTFSYSCFFCN